MKDWIIPALGTYFSWGLFTFFPKVTVKYMGASSAMVYQGIGGFLVAAVVLYRLGFRPETHPTGTALALVTGMIGIVGSLFYLWAVSKGPVSLVVTFTALYPLLTIVLAAALLGEPITPRQGLGILLGLSAIVLIAT